MSKVLAIELRPGALIRHREQLWRVVKSEHVHVGGRGGAYMQVELKEVREGTKLNERLRTDEKVERPFVDGRRMQFLYREGDSFVFMDQESFEQSELGIEIIEGAQHFLLPETEVQVMMLEGAAIGIELPAAVTMEVAETEPRIKGATAAASYKPAKTANGFSVMVPPFIEVGERIRVSTATGQYMERA